MVTDNDGPSATQRTTLRLQGLPGGIPDGPAALTFAGSECLLVASSDGLIAAIHLQREEVCSLSVVET